MGEVKWIHSEHRYAHDALEWFKGEGWQGYYDDKPHLADAFHRYAVDRHRLGDTPESFESLFSDFQRTSEWFTFFPNDAPPEPTWRKVDITEFDSGGWQAARVTMIRTGKMTDIFYEVTYKVGEDEK